MSVAEEHVHRRISRTIADRALAVAVEIQRERSAVRLLRERR
jgi:hypothetical protein